MASANWIINKIFTIKQQYEKSNFNNFNSK